MQDSQAISSHFKTSSGEIRDLFHLLQTAPALMVVCKTPFAILEFINDSALQVWNRRKDEVIGKSIYDSLPQIKASPIEKIIRNVFSKSQRQEVKEFELAYLQNNEQVVTRYFDIILEPILDTDRQVAGFTGSATEVTEQVVARRKIEEREAKLQQTIDELELSINAGKIGTWHWDIKNDVLTWSKQQREMFGITADDFNGKAQDFHRFVIPEDREMVLKASKVDFERSEKLYEFRIRRTDGEIRWIHSRSKTFFNSEGEPVSMTGINIDITERKLAEQQISESEEKYKQLSRTLEEQVKTRTEELREINRQLSEAQKIAQLGNWHWNVKSTEVLWSDEMYRIYGYNNRFPLTFEKAFERMQPDDAQKSRERVAELISKASALFKINGQREFNVPPLVYMVVLPDGSKKVLRGVSKIILDEIGDVSQILGTVQDITENKKAEQDIQIINQQLQEAQQLAQLGYWDWNLQTDKFSWSENLYRIFGLDPSDAMSYQNFIFHVHPDDRAFVEQNFGLSQQKKRFREFYYRIVTPKGFTKTIHMRGEVLMEKGKVIQMKGTAQDVTVEKLIEDKLLDTNKKLGDQYQFVETILNSSANGITVYDTELRYVKMNQAAINFLNRNSDELIGKKLDELYPQLKEVSIYQSLHQALKGEYIHVPRYQSPITGTYFEVHLIPLKDALGKIYGVMSSAHDISELIKNENKILALNETLEQRNQFVEKLINSSLDLVMVIDTELRFITINKKAESVLGEVYKGNLIGKKVTDINPGIVDRDPFTDLLNALKGEVIIRDKVKSTIPGGKYYEHNYIPLFNHAGEVYAVMVISHDITENIRQVEELRKAIESDKLKSDFIKMASHELKTPVTSIKGYVQLVLSMMKENETTPLPPLMVKSCLVSIEKQVNKLTRLMSELLDLSRIESGKLELNYEVFSLNELVIDVVQDLVYTNPRQKINLYHDFNSLVFGDKDRIGQVIVNLLNNAIKYSPDADRIDLTIYQPEKNLVAVTIKDFGIGIDKKEQERIFERFYRAEGQSEQTYPGFGIGLFIAKEMVQRHNGTIHVESEKGKGSVFTFILPQFRKH